MNLADKYALSTGLKIGKPFIYEKYFPVPQEKYITFHPISKPAKNYDYWQDVIDDILPILSSQGIAIYQIGANEDHRYGGCINVNGMTSVNQAAYLIKNGLMHFGTDSFSAHIAGSYDKKLLALYSSCYIQNAKPAWGTPSNQVLLEPERKDGEKPSFALEEAPKQINRIPSEVISNHIFELLELPNRVNYETVYVGENFNNHMFFNIVVPNDSGRVIRNAEVEVRMDLKFDENFLRSQLSVAKCAILTDKPINTDLLKEFKPNIGFLFYIVRDAGGIEFCEQVINMGIPVNFVSDLTEEEINALKIHYYTYGKIDKLAQIPEEDRKKLEEVDPKKLQYKTNKIFTKGEDRFYSVPDVWNGHICNPPHYKPFTSKDFLHDGTLDEYQFSKVIKRLD